MTHPSHKVRFSDSSHHDLICVVCLATDGKGHEALWEGPCGGKREAGTPVPAIGTVADISDVDLLRRAVATARSRDHEKGQWHLRWVGVSDTFALGSTYSRQLCARFGFNPDEEVKR